MKLRKSLLAVKKRVNLYLKRRPHRSFRFTRRRDYTRSLKLPGYWAFTKYVQKTFWANRKIFLLAALVYAIVTTLLVGIASQDIYSTLSDTLKSTGGDFFVGFWGGLGQSGLLFMATITGGISESLTDVQRIYAGLITLLAWLTSVWLLRNILAGHKVKLRDGLYSSGAPILSTFAIMLILVVQLLPLAFALIAYGAASATGLLASGVEAMLFWIVAALLAALSLYLITSTIFALVIVTLPGMYPMQAIKAAGDMVVGRRMRLLSRLLWMALVEMIIWVLIMIPIIMIDSWIKGLLPAISFVPTIPVVLLLLSALTVIWTSGYVYLLYRKVVADDAEPA